MLPPEILVQIFEYVHDWRHRPSSPSSFEPSRTTLLSVILVCKAWNSIAEPILYRQIALDCKLYRQKAYLEELSLDGGLTLSYPDYSKVILCQERLRDNLKQNPDRCGFVEDLYLTSSSKVREGCDEDFPAAIAKMTNLRKIQLHIEQCKPSPDCVIVNSISCIPKLEDLVAYEAWTGPVVRQVMNSNSDVVFPALKNWDISAAGPLEAGCRLPTSREYTSRLEYLYVSYDCHPDTIHELLKWPKALKKFVLDIRFNRCRYAESYTTDSIQRTLDLQSRSLETIRLPGYIHSGSDVIPDFAHFSSLTDLDINQHNVFETDPATAAERIYCPTLKTFTIDMDMEDQQIPGYVTFEDTHVDWVLKFARYYRDLDRKGSLKEIHIRYYWGDDYEWYHSVFDTPWPNASMAALRPNIAEYGFDLTWPKPGLTEEEWFGSDREKKCTKWIDSWRV